MTTFREKLDAIRAAVHADCNHREHRCPCICGCAQTIACDCWSALCVGCQIRYGRDDDEHGYAEDA